MRTRQPLKGLSAIADAYDIAPNTAGKLCRNGTIPAVRLGNQWVLSVDAMRRHLDREPSIAERLIAAMSGEVADAGAL